MTIWMAVSLNAWMLTTFDNNLLRNNFQNRDFALENEAKITPWTVLKTIVVNTLMTLVTTSSLETIQFIIKTHLMHIKQLDSGTLIMDSHWFDLSRNNFKPISIFDSNNSKVRISLRVRQKTRQNHKMFLKNQLAKGLPVARGRLVAKERPAKERPVVPSLEIEMFQYLRP